MPAPSEPSTAPLSRDELQRALALPVLDAAGTSAPLASHLAAGTPTLLVLVRHHHCGMCIEYCRTLWEQLAPATHDAQRPKLLVVGHGEARGIASYKERSGWLGEMVVDPTRKVFGALGCVSGLLNAPEKQPAYLEKHSTASLVLRSAGQMLRSGPLGIWRGGDITQLGGEFLVDADGSPAYTHRMRNTVDHTEVPELAKLLGVDAQPAA
ncbi:hypothetical protein FA09DRAFT_331874 [Tilletiopsis washingtonensis]|uniref:AhpC-TSA-domain-containing protein n=1 Tax=Tilletiopsis washingtonensis TaxID=58919 RepID=A0A316Z3L9_9BASI|nr:hypothetical protein FA09DRAFT_331874 [Tilletiopsis washingtonensis]PWN95548.1 hypothetical protein FA09DRAFT_331874 [Tilletiopsis washingtonensis]